MHTRELWVLDDGDDPLVGRLAAGLGRHAALVLAYLVLRADHEDDPATNVVLQVGTRLNRTAVTDATAHLDDAGLIGRTTVRGAEQGRSLTAWRPVDDRDGTVRRTYAYHGKQLVDQGEALHVDGEHTEPETAAEPDPATETLTLALNWRPNGLHVPVYAALAKDWYGTFDVDVTLDHARGSQRALDALQSGEADVAVAGAATVGRARAAGAPLVPVAVLYQRAMTVLYTVRDAFGEPFRSVDQLAGRRVGMPAQSETRLLGRLFLSQAPVDDVRIVDTGGEERDALVAGRADVVTGSVADPEELRQEGLTVDVLPVTEHFPIYGPVVVVTEETLDGRRPAVERFLAGTTGGWADARQDASPAVARVAAAGGDDPDRVRQTFDQAVETVADSDAVRKHGWGWQRAEMWDRLRTALDQAGLLDSE